MLRVLSIFLLLYTVQISALTLDKQWYDANNTTLSERYTQQLIQLKNELKTAELSQEKKEQLDYRQILLQKLQTTLNEDTFKEYKKIDKIESRSEFIAALKLYKSMQEKFAQRKQDISEYQKRAQTLEEQINSAVENDVSTLNAQLLYAYYQIKSKNAKAFVKQVGDSFNEDKKQFLTALQTLEFLQNSNIRDKLTQKALKVKEIEVDEKRALLKFDKAQIAQNETKMELLSKQILSLKSQKDALNEQLIWLSLEELLPALKAKKSALFFKEFKKWGILVDYTGLNFESINELLKYLSREYIGLTKTTLADTKESFLDIVKYGWDRLNDPFIPLGEGVSIFAISKFFFIFIAGFSVASFYRRRILKPRGYLKNSSAATRTMLSNIGYYFLVFITFIMALKVVGIDLSSLTILVGALSVGIGFGLQNIVSNFISGIILIFEKSIQVGNIIEIDATLRGRVTQINMRSSVITTFDNVDIIIPNSTFIQNNVINLTLTDDIRRLKIPFGVAYGSDIDHVKEVVLRELEKSDLTYIKDDAEKAPKIWMSAMGASSLDLILLVWIHSNANKEGRDPSNISDFLIFIYKTLGENKIEIPFPQLDLHIKKEDGV